MLLWKQSESPYHNGWIVIAITMIAIIYLVRDGIILKILTFTIAHAIWAFPAHSLFFFTLIKTYSYYYYIISKQISFQSVMNISLPIR